MSKRIVVTGATGYIGQHIIKEGIDKGYEIICLVNSNSSRINSIPRHENIEIIECSMSEYNNLKIAKKCDLFFHLAWANTSGAGRDDANSQIANIQNTIDALHLAKQLGCTAFVGAGSQAEYGVVKDGVTLSSDTACNPSSGYGIAKYAAGKLCALTARQLGVRFNWVRILSIYGNGDSPNSLISYVIEEFTHDRTPKLSPCEQIWDYLNVLDAASAFWAVAQSGVDGETYVLGSGQGSQLREYITKIKTITGAKCDIGFGFKEYYPHQPMFLQADIRKLTKDTGWTPQIDFEEGIRIMIDKKC